MEVGDRLRAARERRGLTQSDLAAKLGVSPVTVTLWENRRNRRQINAKYLPKIAELLEIRVSELLGELGNAETPTSGLVTIDRAETLLLRAFRLMPQELKLFQLAQIVESAGLRETDSTRGKSLRVKEPTHSSEISEPR